MAATIVTISDTIEPGEALAWCDRRKLGERQAQRSSSPDTESAAYTTGVPLCTHNYSRLGLTLDGPRDAPTGTVSVTGLNIRVMGCDRPKG